MGPLVFAAQYNAFEGLDCNPKVGQGSPVSAQGTRPLTSDR